MASFQRGEEENERLTSMLGVGVLVRRREGEDGLTWVIFTCTLFKGLVETPRLEMPCA